MTPNLIPFDMANLLDCEEAIEEYLMQVMTDGDSAELARARLHIDRARARSADQPSCCFICTNATRLPS
jgi:hypothetical protein